MLTTFQDFADSLPEALQWLGVFLVAAIPFVESYFGSAIGVLAGINPIVAVAAAICGNIISMLIFVLSAHGIRSKATANREPVALTPKRQKLKDRMDRFGVPVVSLAGQIFLPSQITSAAMVSFGASKNLVIFWQIISIIIWGVLFGVLASLGVAVVS